MGIIVAMCCLGGGQAPRTLPSANMPVDWKRCSLCGKFQSENQSPMKRCARCHQSRGISTFYCVRNRRAATSCTNLTNMVEQNENCQREHWPKHRVSCRQDVEKRSNIAQQEAFKSIQKWLSVHADLLVSRNETE